jgi:predicted  nucleic acid-binding Zn-ribbon protein
MFEKDTRSSDALTNEVIGRIDNNTRRVRTVEQRIEGLELRMGSAEEKMIEEVNNLKREFERISIDLKEINKTLADMHDEIIRINKDVDKTAKKNEVKELESLLDLYNPIKSKFVTKDEVRNMIDDRISEKS